MPDNTDHRDLPTRRSSGALKYRREALKWRTGREFRILSLDGGGIRGVFPASVLAGLEERYLHGESLAKHFDLIAGTSTGGIIAIGLGAGLRAADIQRMYIERGDKIFPPDGAGPAGVAQRGMRWMSKWFRYRYDRSALNQLLKELLGDLRLEESLTRLCIPSFDGRHGEVYIFKTPHHPDFKLDGVEYIRKVAAATAAAPTFFRPLRDGGYVFVDGGVWANNPVMVAVVDALSCFDVPRNRISVLSLGCGTGSCRLTRTQMFGGGILAWRYVIDTAMSLQSQNALGQAGLLIGAERLMRIDAPPASKNIELDDWRRAVSELPAAADQALAEHGDAIADAFFTEPAEPYRPYTTSVAAPVVA